MSKLYINTTQNVPLYFTPASVGERMLGYFIDLVIKYAYLIIAYFIFFAGTDLFELLKDKDWAMILIMLFISLPVIFYSLVSEFLMEGQTLGKKLVKIRVVKIDGYEAGFFEYFLRWIFRIIDMGMMDIPGLIAMITTKHTQRLGDLAAGTAVVSEKSKYNISHTILMNVEDDYKPYFSQNQVLLFTDNDIRIIKENANNAIKQGNLALLIRLARKIESVMSVENTFPNEKEFIRTLLKDYNHYTGQ